MNQSHKASKYKFNNYQPATYDCSGSTVIRKTFKKLYEQKDLVRNTKDQYGAVCDNIWKQSYQRLIPSIDVKSINEKESDLSLGKVSQSLDFFDIKSSKKVNNSTNRYNIKTYLATSYALDIKDDKSSFTRDIAKLTNDNKNLEGRVSQLSNWGLRPRSPEGNSVKSLEVKSIRKNTAKLLQRDDTSNSTEGRSVVNIGLENYSKRVKMKTLNESLG